jgi:hypothetical protein
MHFRTLSCSFIKAASKEGRKKKKKKMPLEEQHPEFNDWLQFWLSKRSTPASERRLAATKEEAVRAISELDEILGKEIGEDLT